MVGLAEGKGTETSFAGLASAEGALGEGEEPKDCVVVVMDW
jgi:hypothetical protein